MVSFFDFSVLVLIIFPFVTGGVWIQRPGLFIELADLGVPVLLVSILALILKLGFKAPLEKGRIVEVSLRLWAWWVQSLERFPRLTLWVASLLVGGLWSWASLTRHHSFGSSSYDLGIFTNALWNLIHGNGYVSAPKGGINLFSDHQSPLFWLFAPVFAVFPHPETLLIVQGVGLAAGGAALYVLGKQYSPDLKVRWPACLPLLYWMYNPLRTANAFDVHPEVLMLPLFLWGIAGLQGRALWARVGGVVAFVLALAAKESAGPVAMGIGLAWILGAAPNENVTANISSLKRKNFTRFAGLLLFILGGCVFFFNVKIVPRLLGGDYAYLNVYSEFGKGVGDVLLSPFQKPLLFFGHLVGKSRFKFLFWTLAPLGFLPLKNLKPLIAAVPGYLMLFLGAGDHRLGTIYHYGIEPSVGLFWALAGVANVNVFGNKLKKTWITLWLLFWVFGTFGRSELFRIRHEVETPHMQWLRSEVIPCVSDEVSVAASNALVPHLAMRPWIQSTPTIQMRNGGLVGCVIYDSEVNNWTLGWTLGNQVRPDILAWISTQGYREVYSCGALRILQKINANVSCIKCVPICK